MTDPEMVAQRLFQAARDAPPPDPDRLDAIWNRVNVQIHQPPRAETFREDGAQGTPVWKTRVWWAVAAVSSAVALVLGLPVNGGNEGTSQAVAAAEIPDEVVAVSPPPPVDVDRTHDRRTTASPRTTAAINTVRAPPPVPKVDEGPRTAEKASPPRMKRKAAGANRKRAAEATPSDDLAAEARSLARVRASIRQGRHGNALQQLKRHGSEFPRGRLIGERRALRVLALCGAGKRERARSEAKSLVKGHPRAPFVAALTNSCVRDVVASKQ